MILIALVYEIIAGSFSSLLKVSIRTVQQSRALVFDFVMQSRVISLMRRKDQNLYVLRGIMLKSNYGDNNHMLFGLKYECN